MSQLTSAPRVPYSLEPAAFEFPALAAMCGRAALGGPRETALACLVVCRMVADVCDGAHVLDDEMRRARAASARHWLGATAVPGPVRAALSKLAETTAGGPKSAIREALDSVITVTANQLDQAARFELGKLAQAVAE